jgi:Zn finger protein HypA/HybF involved in hydrogenase expression
MKEYYQKDKLEQIVSESYSFAEALRKIGLRDVGSNFKTIKKYVKEYNIDTSHFRGQTWNKGMGNTDYAAYNKLENILKENTNFKSDTLKYRLVKEGLKQWKCEKCGNEGVWKGEELVLELHHINGNHYDNRLENLQILCPNCHSQTDNFRNKNSIKAVKPKKHVLYVCKCDYCGKEFRSNKKNKRFCCREHYNEFLCRKQNPVTKEMLEKEIINCTSISELANKLKTTRPTIRKYLQDYDLYETFKEKYATNTIHSKEIIQYDLKMQKIKEWGSITDASETLGITTINKCLSFKRKTAGGFIWRYRN